MANPYASSSTKRKRPTYGDEQVDESSSEGKVSSFGDVSCLSEALFDDDKDRIIYAGELSKFKPGISANFI